LDGVIGDIKLLVAVVVLFLLLFDMLKESKETKSLNKSLLFPFDEVDVVVVELNVLFDCIGFITLVLNKLFDCMGVELNRLLDCILIFVVVVVLAVEEAGGGLDMNKENKSSLALFVFDVVVLVCGALWNDWKSAKSSILLLVLVLALSKDWKSAHSSSLELLLLFVLLDEAAGSSKPKSNKLVSLTSEVLLVSFLSSVEVELDEALFLDL